LFQLNPHTPIGHERMFQLGYYRTYRFLYAPGAALSRTVKGNYGLLLSLRLFNGSL
jgi:hypothetical protein